MASKEREKDPFIVVILGCTGTGKSKLSIEIGRHLEGEIISADSMQVYRDLDIVTNKVTAEEQSIIPHHFLDFVDSKHAYSVTEFQESAMKIISDLHNRQKIPIIVGGTNYFIEALLWNHLIDERKASGNVMETPAAEMAKNVSVCEHFIPSSGRNQVEAGGEADVPRGARPHEAEKKTECCEVVDGTDEISEECYENNEVGKEDGSTESERELLQEKLLKNNPETTRRLHLHRKCEVREVDGSTEGGSTVDGTESLHEQLSKIDPEMARRLHPNNVRKIKRSLQIYHRTGTRHSELIARQHSEVGSSPQSGAMRFKNVCVLWIRCGFETLDERLDARVDKMIEMGLVRELVDFCNSCGGIGNEKGTGEFGRRSASRSFASSLPVAIATRGTIPRCSRNAWTL